MTVNRFNLIERAMTADLLAQERLVLVFLSQRVRTTGQQQRLTWVKQSDIASGLRMPVRNVQRHLDQLEKSRYIQRWRTKFGYLYRIPPTWDEVDASDGANTVH